MVTSAIMNGIRYANSTKEVRPGDRVKVRMYFFFWRRGRIVYVPGISAMNPELEFNGGCQIGVWFWKGDFGGYEVDSDRGTVAKNVKFERRDDSVAPKWPPPGSWQ